MTATNTSQEFLCHRARIIADTDGIRFEMQDAAEVNAPRRALDLAHQNNPVFFDRRNAEQIVLHTLDS